MHPDKYALNVLSSLSVFADKQSNVVLEVLAGQIPHENEKFPKGELNFGNAGWRGFYHCHPAAEKHLEEHGHFHLFARCAVKQDNSTDWTHVVALSIDEQGQPRAWFTVNQWVTGANWLAASEIELLLEDIKIPADVTVIEKFLLSMLGLYQDDLKDILLERDSRLIQVNAEVDVSDKLCDRSIYVLSSQPIELQQRLQLAVSG